MTEESKRKHILFLIPSLYGGGAEKVCCILASALSKRHQVTVAYLFDSERQYPFSPECELVRVPDKVSRRWYRAGNIRRVLKRAAFVRRLKKEKQIDAAVSFLIPASEVNILSRRGERVVTSERANPRKYMPEQFWRTRLMYALSGHVVFQSEMVRSLYGKYIRRHSSIIRNPVSVPFPADPVRKKRIVTMGRLVEQKNHAMLIRSFAAFLRECPGYTLSIYGEGELRPELSGLIAGLRLEDSVFLEGNVQAIHEAVRDAEMFVLPSNYEGLSNALLECMAMGIACISTACEGSVDVIRNGENGILVGVGREKELTEAMIYLARHPEIRKKFEEKTRQESADYSVDRIVKQWEEVLFGHKTL